MEQFKTVKSNSNSSEETKYTFEQINHVTQNSFSDTDVILGSARDSCEVYKLPSAPPVPETNSKFIVTGSNVKTKTFSEKLTSSSEKLIKSSKSVQRPTISLIPAISTRSLLITNPSNFDPPSVSPPPPPLTMTEAGKSKPFKHRKSFDSTSSYCDKPITPIQ